METQKTDDIILYTNALTKKFDTFTAVDGVDLSVKRGEIFGFLGLNGAGKTTTIRMMLGMIRPTFGQTYLFGEKVDAGNYALWERVGYLVETPYAYPELTVRENLAIIAKLRSLKDRHAVDKIMEKLQLTQYADRKARHLSLGNAQRLGLAKALIHNPDLLILDEPTNGLDPAGIVEIRDLLHYLAHNEDVTIFTSSHILGEMTKLITSMGIIHKGKLLQTMGADELAKLMTKRLAVQTRNNDTAKNKLAQLGYKAEGGRESLYFSDAQVIQQPDIIAVELVKMGIPPTQLTLESEDLEAYFLRIIDEKNERNSK